MSFIAWLFGFIVLLGLILAARNFLLKSPLSNSEQIEARLPEEVLEAKLVDFWLNLGS